MLFRSTLLRLESRQKLAIRRASPGFIACFYQRFMWNSPLVSKLTGAVLQNPGNIIKKNGPAGDFHCKAVWVTVIAQPKSLYLPFVKVKKQNSAVKKRISYSCWLHIVYTIPRMKRPVNPVYSIRVPEASGLSPRKVSRAAMALSRASPKYDSFLLDLPGRRVYDYNRIGERTDKTFVTKPECSRMSIPTVRTPRTVSQR